MNLKQLCSRGAVGIEAAIVLPIMVFLMFGTIETYQYYRVVAIMDRAAFSIADGIAMQTELHDGPDCTATENICTYGSIARNLMQPLNYDDDGEMVIRLFVASDAGGSATVWSNNEGWSKRCLGTGTCQNISAIAANDQLPQGMPEPLSTDTVLMVQLQQKYEPFVISSIFWQKMGGVRNLTSTVYYRPRFDDLKNIN